jgi:hypothetical protein
MDLTRTADPFRESLIPPFLAVHGLFIPEYIRALDPR